jgi:hypothetical protein
MFDSYTREQLRQAYADAWRKHLASAPLSALEASIAAVISLHPEYQSLMKDGVAPAFEVNPASGTANPFLHMGLHLAVRDQISIDRPPGIRAVYRQLQVRLAGEHDAEHALGELLGETLWEAQRNGHPPDENRYMARARRLLEG